MTSHHRPLITWHGNLILQNSVQLSIFFLWRCNPALVMASSFLRFLDHTQRGTTVGRTPLDEWSARRRDLYLTTHNTHNRQTFMPPVGFEPTISAGERPQTYALDRAATGTGPLSITDKISDPHWWFYLSSTQKCVIICWYSATLVLPEGFYSLLL